MYTNLDYARGRLSGSVVRDKNGEPLGVLDVLRSKKGLVCVVSYLKSSGDPSDMLIDDLDLTPVPLGYINYQGRVTYASRIPQRGWKQGLRSSNTNYSYRGEFRNVSNSSLRKTILNDYPSLEKCVDRITSGKAEAMAFSRSFCLKHEGEVWYKDLVCVGSFSPRTKEVIINKEFSWTQEEFMKGVGDEKYVA